MIRLTLSTVDLAHRHARALLSLDILNDGTGGEHQASYEIEATRNVLGTPQTSVHHCAAKPLDGSQEAVIETAIMALIAMLPERMAREACFKAELAREKGRKAARLEVSRRVTKRKTA